MFETYIDLLEKVTQEIQNYNEKPTKACSLRIRKLTNQLGKEGKFLRADLLAADKAK